MAQQIIESIIVNGEVAEIFRLWADFEKFPYFMKNIRAVTKTGPNTSHWVMQGPLGNDFRWNARTTRMEADKRIAWNSIDGDLKTSGQVTFNDLSNNEIEITLILEYVPPGGVAGEVAAKLFENPKQRVSEDLRNFKAYAEKMSRVHIMR